MSSMLEASLEALRIIFSDKPDALKVFDLQSLESQYVKDKLRNSAELFAEIINLWAVGRTGAGKTTIGNVVLDSKVMKSNGMQDCTDFVGFFQLASNLRFWDTPGIGSDINFENITRTALKIDQNSGSKYSRPPVILFKNSDYLLIKDFTKCTSESTKPEVEECTIAQWQSDQNQENVKPDVILFVMAPDKQFLDSDRNFLGDLLETSKSLNDGKCIVIPVLNIFEKEDGTIKPTPQERAYAREEISGLYKRVFGNDEDLPPVVEVIAKTGKGIPQITELICQVLPPEKIGSLSQVLRDELKGYAEQERVSRYYRTLSLIAGCLAKNTVNKTLEGQNLFQAASQAICAYGIMTFKNLEAVNEIKNELDSLSQQVEQFEKAQSETITEKEKVTAPQELKRIVPKTEEVKVDVDNWVPKETKDTDVFHVDVPEIDYKDVKKTRKVDVKKERNWFGKFMTGEKYYKTGGQVDEDYWDKELDIKMGKQRIEKDVYRTTWVKETTQKIENRVTGYEEEVIGTIDVVVAEVDKVVGTKFLAGGYPAIKLLLSLGLGVQNFASKANTSWAASMAQGELIIERKLSPLKSQIEQLVDDPKGENKLIQLLENALIG